MSIHHLLSYHSGEITSYENQAVQLNYGSDGIKEAKATLIILAQRSNNHDALLQISKVYDPNIKTVRLEPRYNANSKVVYGQWVDRIWRIIGDAPNLTQNDNWVLNLEMIS